MAQTANVAVFFEVLFSSQAYTQRSTSMHMCLPAIALASPAFIKRDIRFENHGATEKGEETKTDLRTGRNKP
jgi:hypothetical protein